MKIPRLLKHKKLRAATARRSSTAPAGMDFEEMPEPNMKLSRALLVVLLLHVVAVSGIIAFNAIKTRENSFVPARSTNVGPEASATSQSAIQTGGAKSQTAIAQNAPRNDSSPLHSISKPSSKDDHSDVSSDVKQPLRKGTTSQETAARKPVSDGKTYVVKKGDNPVTIAKKLKVPYDDLMALNHIEDARKLRIGQKLLIPKITKPQKTDKKAVDDKGKKNAGEKKIRRATQSQNHNPRNDAS